MTRTGRRGSSSLLAPCRALYAYTASPDDPNEVSFGKGEMLDILDSSGKWWQCRTSAGQVGSESLAWLEDPSAPS